MTLLITPSANAVALHTQPEDFLTAAHSELAEWSPWEKGVCFNPACGRVFTPSRDWQIYCCAECQATGKAEMRKWGNRMALPSLVWRMGKYEKNNEAQRAAVRAARRYFTHLQSAWLADRQARANGVIL